MGTRALNGAKERLIHQQFEELVQGFPDLTLCQDAPGRWVIRGELSFYATFKDVTITDAFSVLIILPDN